MESGGIVAYVALAAQQIAVVSVDVDTGTMELRQVVDVHDGVAPDGVRPGRYMSLAVSPDQRSLFAGNRTAPYYMRSFAIDRRNGLLTHLNDAPTPESSPYLCVDRSGRYLLAAHNPPNRNRRDGLVSVSVITDQGFVLEPHQVVHVGPKAHAVRTDHANRHVLVTSCDGDVVHRLAFDEVVGLLDPDGLALLYVRPGSGPRHFLFHPNNRFMYMINEYDGAIYVYTYDARTGAMAEIQLENIRPDDFPAAVFLDKEEVEGPNKLSEFPEEPNPRAGDLHFTPDGRWLYASARATSTLAVFAVDARTGLVTPEGHVEVGREPRGFNVDPFGRYLLSGNLYGESLSTWTIDSSTGGLSLTSTLEGLHRPNWVEFARLP